MLYRIGVARYWRDVDALFLVEAGGPAHLVGVWPEGAALSDALEIGPNRFLILAGSWPPDGYVDRLELWDLEARTARLTTIGRFRHWSRAVISPDGRRFAFLGDWGRAVLTVEIGRAPRLFTLQSRLEAPLDLADIDNSGEMTLSARKAGAVTAWVLPWEGGLARRLDPLGREEHMSRQDAGRTVAQQERRAAADARRVTKGLPDSGTASRMETSRPVDLREIDVPALTGSATIA